MSIVILIIRVVLTIVAGGGSLIVVGEEWQRGKGYRDPLNLTVGCAGGVALLWVVWMT